MSGAGLWPGRGPARRPVLTASVGPGRPPHCCLHSAGWLGSLCRGWERGREGCSEQAEARRHTAPLQLSSQATPSTALPCQTVALSYLALTPQQGLGTGRAPGGRRAPEPSRRLHAGSQEARRVDACRVCHGRRRIRPHLSPARTSPALSVPGAVPVLTRQGGSSAPCHGRAPGAQRQTPAARDHEGPPRGRRGPVPGRARTPPPEAQSTSLALSGSLPPSEPQEPRNTRVSWRGPLWPTTGPRALSADTLRAAEIKGA